MEDQQIIALYWQRSEAAIEFTQEKYGSYCLAIAANILPSKQDSEECVNDTWLRTWQAIPPARPNCLRLFLAKITRNLALDRFRSLSAEKRNGSQTALLLDELQECLPSSDNTEHTVLAADLTAAVNGFLRSLSAKERRLFVRRYFYAESVTELAANHHITANHAAVILGRIRKKLRIYLETEGYL